MWVSVPDSIAGVNLCIRWLHYILLHLVNSTACRLHNRQRDIRSVVNTTLAMLIHYWIQNDSLFSLVLIAGFDFMFDQLIVRLASHFVISNATERDMCSCIYRWRIVRASSTPIIIWLCHTNNVPWPDYVLRYKSTLSYVSLSLRDQSVSVKWGVVIW